jgi:16S rRNA (guanine966-N2)-methyltransferase
VVRQARSSAPGRVRIIAGLWRGRRIEVPSSEGLRPTPDRVRETLFNWLGQDLSGRSCLDLFAGSGALGFEAASRGATRVVLVERDRTVLAVLERTRSALGARNVEIVARDALEHLRSETARFDVVFLDPPFRQNALSTLLPLLPRCLARGARVYVEGERAIEAIAPWRELKSARAGQVSYQLLEWDDHDQDGVSGNV